MKLWPSKKDETDDGIIVEFSFWALILYILPLIAILMFIISWLSA